MDIIERQNDWHGEPGATRLEILVHGNMDEINAAARLLAAKAIEGTDGYPLDPGTHWFGAEAGEAVLSVPEDWMGTRR